MTTTEEIRQELNEAKVKEQKAEAAVQEFEGRYGGRLTWLEDKLRVNEGTEGTEGTAEERAEKTRLEKRRESLEADKRECRQQVEKLQRDLTEAMKTQPGNNFVTWALGTQSSDSGIGT